MLVCCVFESTLVLALWFVAIVGLLALDSRGAPSEGLLSDTI